MFYYDIWCMTEIISHRTIFLCSTKQCVLIEKYGLSQHVVRVPLRICNCYHLTSLGILVIA
jgi:hypothetical protein